MITRGIAEILPGTQIELGRYNAGVPERKLDLFQGRLAGVGETGVGAAHVVRRRRDPNCRRILSQYRKDRLWRQAAGLNLTFLVNGPEDAPLKDAGQIGPPLDGGSNPVRN